VGMLDWLPTLVASMWTCRTVSPSAETRITSHPSAKYDEDAMMQIAPFQNDFSQLRILLLAKPF
jgi:hypothetical protein